MKASSRSYFDVNQIVIMHYFKTKFEKNQCELTARKVFTAFTDKFRVMNRLNCFPAMIKRFPIKNHVQTVA